MRGVLFVSSYLYRSRSCVVPSRPSRLAMRRAGRLLPSRCFVLRSIPFCRSHVPSLSSVPPLVSSCDASERDDLRFYPMSSGVLCRLAFLLASLVRSSSSRPPPSFAFVSSSFVVVGMGVSLRGACGEIELTKTAHFNALVISVSSCSCSCSCCVAMGIGPGRTGVRQWTGASLFGRSFCRICPQVVSAN